MTKDSKPAASQEAWHTATAAGDDWRAAVARALAAVPDASESLRDWLLAASLDSSDLPDMGIGAQGEGTPTVQAERLLVATAAELRMTRWIVGAMAHVLAGGQGQGFELISPVTMDAHLLFNVLARRLGAGVGGPAGDQAGPLRVVPAPCEASLAAFLLRVFQALRGSMPMHPARDGEVERAVGTAQTAIAELHVLCLVVTGLTSRHLACDFPAVMRVLDALRRHGVVVVLDLSTARCGQLGSQLLTGLRTVFNPCMGNEQAVALDRYWELLGRGQAFPAALKDLCAAVFGQRRWMREVLAEAATPPCRLRSRDLSMQAWTDWLWAVYGEPLHQWTALMRGEELAVQWRDWVPDPAAFGEAWPSTSLFSRRGSGKVAR